MSTGPEEKADEFRVAGQSPIKRFAERPTIFRILGDLAGRSVLDLACGSGFYTRALKERGAERVVGVDLSSDMIAAARAEEDRNPLGIEYRRHDVLDMETIGTFDVVTAAYLLVYAETRAALRTMCETASRHLRPGGTLVATVIHPNLSIEDQMPIEKTGGIVEAADGGDLVDGTPLLITIGKRKEYRARDYFWTAATYEACLREAGFSTVEWHELQVSEEGVKSMGQEFWDTFLANPTVAVLTARAG